MTAKVPEGISPEVLAREEKFRNKPAWDSHGWPYIAQDSSGEWWGYGCPPKQIHHGWDKTGHCGRLSAGQAIGAWENTLEGRPMALTPTDQDRRIAELEQQLRDTNRLAAEQKKRDKARILELDTCYSTMLAQRNGARAELSVARRERDMFKQAEIEWERAMMNAIGEDGVCSVAKAIMKLQAERDAALSAAQTRRSWFQRLTDALREVMA